MLELRKFDRNEMKFAEFIIYAYFVAKLLLFPSKKMFVKINLSRNSRRKKYNARLCGAWPEYSKQNNVYLTIYS
jgi:hypothetical protein